MGMVSITIDGKKLNVPNDITVLEAAKIANIHIPTLCYLKDINEIGACRMCIVKVKNVKSLQAACVLPVSEGMEILTNSPDVREARKVVLELILSNHDRDCTVCVRNQNCELQKISAELNIKEIRFNGKAQKMPIDDLSPAIVRNPNKCILCRRCVSVCVNIQKDAVIGPVNRGYNTSVSPVFGKSINDVPCANCGQCIEVCPVGALTEKDDTEKVWDALQNPDIHVIVQTAPAVRAALGEEFGMSAGTIVKGKMVAALRRMGFDKVFDTDFAADLTVMEEGTELIDRINNGGELPLITSCSPGWIKYCEHFYPEFIKNLSTCKSPHEMMGAVLKTYYAEKNGIDPANIYVVSVMPCTAKKFEIRRPELSESLYQDVDAVITTRELAKMIKELNIDFLKLSDENFDMPFGESTGAAVLFGTTGGVMEAALRTVSELITGKSIDQVEYKEVRGLEGIKEAEIRIGDKTLNVAAVHGLSNADKLLQKIKNENKQYHFIEIMGCPGGCIMGGGQPILSNKIRNEVDVAAKRAEALYNEDRNFAVRKSHENNAVERLYDEFLGKPGSTKSHQLLHTHYVSRGKYSI